MPIRDAAEPRLSVELSFMGCLLQHLPADVPMCFDVFMYGCTYGCTCTSVTFGIFELAYAVSVLPVQVRAAQRRPVQEAPISSRR